MRLPGIALAVLALAAPLAAAASAAGAAVTPPPRLTDELLDAMGFKLDARVRPGSCDAVLTMDGERFRELAPVYQRGFFAPDLPPAFILAHHVTLKVGVATQMAALAVRRVYLDNPAADACRFSAKLSEADDFGNPAVQPLVAFGFTRALFARVNWDAFVLMNVVRVSRAFTMSPWAMARVAEERTAD